MNKLFKLFFLLTLMLGISQCGGTGLVEQFTGNESGEVGAVEVMALQHLRDGSEGEISPESTKIFENDLGYTIELNHAEIHLHNLTLLSSGDDPQCQGQNDIEVDLHHDHDLLGPDLITHHLATAVIPQIFYCEFDLELGSNDHAALKFSEGHEGSEVGNSPVFHFMGHWSNDSDSGDFMLMGMETTVVHHVFKTMENDEVIDHPIHFHEGEEVIQVLIGIKYDLAFDGVDFVGQSPEAQVEAIYDNLNAVVHQHTGAHHGSGGGDHDTGGNHEHP